MLKIEKDNLLKLDKEDLIQIIADYKSILTWIGEACVEASKENRSNKQAMEDIRRYLYETDQYRLYDDDLKEKLKIERDRKGKNGL